jgi:coiled-coil domain-containing protein 130
MCVCGLPFLPSFSRISLEKHVLRLVVDAPNPPSLPSYLPPLPLQAGHYFSTKIWEFHMKCATCKNLLIIRTDPKNCDYEFVEGIRKREQEYDAEAIGIPILSVEPSGGGGGGGAAVPTSATAPNAGVSVDPLVALERSKDQKRQTNAAAARLQELIDANNRLEADTSGVNRLMRTKFRGEKKVLQALEDESAAKGLRFRMLPASEEDGREGPAALLAGGSGGLTRARREGFKKGAKTKFTSIMSSSIFDDAGSSDRKRKSLPSSSSSSALVMVAQRGSSSSSSSSSIGLQSKAVAAAEAKKALAIKRAKLGINPANFSMAASSVPGMGSSSSSVLSTVVARKKG